MIAYDVELGLRARLASSGIGGPTFIEVDFMDAATFPARPIAWIPEGIHIPSAPSAGSRRSVIV